MKYYIFLLTILSAVGFFNPHGMFSEQLQKLAFYLCILSGFAVAFLESKSYKQECTYPRRAYMLILLGIAVSIVSASLFHMQSLIVSIVTTLPFLLSYAFFFILVRFNLSERIIMNTFLWLCAASSVVYFCNALTFPQNIFGIPLEEDLSRGIIRIPLVFIEAFPLVVLYSINKWLLTKEKKWLFIMSWAFLMIVLSVVRQIIALTAILGLFFFMRNVSWKIKTLMAAGVVAIVVFVLPMIPVYNAILELTEKQSQENENEEDIRIQAMRFYTYEDQTNALTPIIGNGVPSFGNSRWGITFDSETQDNGCFYADVSWTGFFWLFGAVATASLLVFIIKAILKNKRKDRQYLNYTLTLIAITSVACGILVYYFQIVVLMTMLYLAYRDDPEDEIEDENAQITAPSDKSIEKPDGKPSGFPQLR